MDKTTVKKSTTSTKKSISNSAVTKTTKATPEKSEPKNKRL